MGAMAAKGYILKGRRLSPPIDWMWVKKQREKSKTTSRFWPEQLSGPLSELEEDAGACLGKRVQASRCTYANFEMLIGLLNRDVG